MKKVKIKKEKTVGETCSLICPFCVNTINGTSVNHVRKNFDMHVFSRHKDEEENIEVVE